MGYLVIGCRDHQRDTARRTGSLDTGNEIEPESIECPVKDMRDDQADGVGATCLEASRQGIGVVIEHAGDAFDELAGPGRNVAVPIESTRDRRCREPSCSGNVANGGGTPFPGQPPLLPESETIR